MVNLLRFAERNPVGGNYWRSSRIWHSAFVKHGAALSRQSYFPFYIWVISET
jgi:hypothetical protein